jgi:WASH complex subunit strumpellin
MNFTSESNLCGQTLLRLVSHGNSIISEILRLSHYIPEVFTVNDKKYSDIIFDFRYMNNEDMLDQKIQKSSVLKFLPLNKKRFF